MTSLTAAQIQTTYAQGLKLQGEKSYLEALRVYGRILRANQDIAEVHFQVGRILSATGKAVLAIGHLRRAVTLRPSEKLVWDALAEAVALGGNEESELALLRELKTAPIAAPARIRLQDRFGAHRSASKPATGGLPPSEIHKMIALLDAGRLADAEARARAAVKQFPRSAIAYNILGTAELLQGKAKPAEANTRMAIRLDPDYAEAFENLGRLLTRAGRHEEAQEAFRQAVILTPARTPAIIALAAIMTRNSNPQGALPILSRALRYDDDNPELHRALGNAFVGLKQDDRAEIAFGRAVALYKDRAPSELISLYAQALANNGKDEEALSTFDSILARDPESAAATRGKAMQLQSFGRFDEAEKLFRRAFDLDPNNGDVYRMFITSHKTKPGDPVLAKMMERFDDPVLSEDERTNFGFAIAKALEDVKDYDNVFRYLDEANALVTKQTKFDLTLRRRDVNIIKRAFDGTDWIGREVPGASTVAPIFVTGMPRSGTTLVEQIIASHSTVVGGGELGEVSVAANKLLIERGRPRRIQDIPDDELTGLGIDFEELLAERFPGATHVTDKSILSYMAIGQLRLAMPNSRIVVVRRDPRDNLLSIYKNKFPANTHLYAYDQRTLAAYYDTFVEIVDFWREKVPDWFYEVQYEELVANPEEEARKLIAACNLEWEDACLNFHENDRKIQTLSIFQARQPISSASVKSWQRFEKDLKPMLDVLREDGHVAD